MKARNAFASLIIAGLFCVIELLTRTGIGYAFAFATVFAGFDLLLITLIKRRVESMYGKSRALNLFTYGSAFIVFLLTVLFLLQN